MIVTGNAPGRTKYLRESKTPYPTMSIEEIKALPIKNIMSKDGAHIYLWTTNQHLEFAWDIMRGWGAIPKQLLTWVKKPKGMIGFGTYSPCTEFCLFGTSAKKAINISRSERTWFEWARTIKHSEKPQGFFDIVEKVSPLPRIDVFARREREGWDVFGNEVNNSVDLEQYRSNGR
jgi:N6-adenosine-specific RNA methylase IME4